MRNEERTAIRAGQAQQISGEAATLDLPETEKKSFKFKSFFTGSAAKKGIGKFGAKNIVIVLSVLLIGAAVYVNWRLFGGAKTETPADGADPAGVTDEVKSTEAVDYFASAEVSRKQARDEAMEVLQGVVDDSASLDAAKEQALADIAAIAANIELEANIESLVKAKGFTECVAVIKGGAATITVESEGLKPNQLSQILEIVYVQAGIVPANVTINEK